MKMVCEIDRNKPLTFWERLLGGVAFLSPFIGIALVALTCGGCVNCIVRHSPQPPHIEEVYQPTRMAASGCVILACPQIMSDAPTHGLCAENIVSIPLGILAFCLDVPLEFVVDTVCLPYDAYRQFM